MLNNIVLWLIVISCQIILANQQESENKLHPHTIKIFVLEKGTAYPIKRAEIKLGEKIYYTNPEGIATIEIEKGFTTRAKVSHVGYDSVYIKSNKVITHKEIKIYLMPALDKDRTIIIQGKRKATISRKKIPIKEAEQVAPQSDPAQVIRLLPGVQSRLFNDNIIIRGSDPSDSRYFVDQFEMPGIFHPIGTITMFPSPLLSEVQLDTGGFSSRYGDATGGIIVLKTKDTVPKYAKMSFVVNLPIYSGLYYEKPLNSDSFFSLSFRRSYLDFIIKAILKARDMDDLIVTPYFTDAHGFYYKKTSSGYWKVIIMGAEDGFLLATPIDTSANEDTSFNLSFNERFLGFGVEYQRRLLSSLSLNIAPQISDKFSKLNISATKSSGPITIDDHTTTIQLPTKFTYKINKKDRLIWGIIPKYIHYKKEIHLPEDTDEDRQTPEEEEEPYDSTSDEKSYRGVFWVRFKKNIYDFQITPGSRLFYNSQIRQGGIDPRLSMQYSLSKKDYLKLSVGQYSKHPELIEAATELNQDSEPKGNPDLNFEKSLHYVLGWNSYWADAWETELQFYYKKIFHKVETNPQDTNDTLRNIGEQRTKGIELFVRRKLTNRFFGWISYTYSKSEEKDLELDKFFLNNIDQTHNISFVSGYKLSQLWKTVLRYNHTSGELYNPIDRVVYDAGQDSYIPRFDPQKKNSERIPNYHNLSFYLNKEFLGDTWKMSFKFGLETYWPTKQIVDQYDNYDYSKKEYITGVPIPFLELRGQF
jgi:hypothetical protein